MEWINWILFGPAKLIAHLPYAGFAIGTTFIGLQVARSLFDNGRFDKHWFRKAPVFTGLLWAIFNLYELQLAAVLVAANAGGVNPFVLLRLDLIVLTPVLYVLTAFAGYSVIFPPKNAASGKTGNAEDGQ